MSWYGASDVEEPAHHILQHNDNHNDQRTSAILDLQALLDTEREAHRLAKHALETARLDIKEWMSKVHTHY